jgi:hypothetical protein
VAAPVQALAFAPKDDRSAAAAASAIEGRARGLALRALGRQAREVSELFVNPEERICRTEGRWRLTTADLAGRAPT